jgi:predicted O-methyltransferase YrrM
MGINACDSALRKYHAEEQVRIQAEQLRIATEQAQKVQEAQVTGEVVLTPFGGIGSEAYMALKLGRKATLIELKPEYFNVAVNNLRQAELNSVKQDMFSGVNL